MNAAEFAKQIETEQRKSLLAKQQNTWRPVYTPATDIGNACVRRSCLHRLWPEKAEPISEELAAIFREGNLHQSDVRAELNRLGFEVVESEVNFKDDRLQISGTIDGKILIKTVLDELAEMARHGESRIPVEIKSFTGNPPANEDAWKHSDNRLHRKYYAQISIYLYLTNSPVGLGLFKNKTTGLWTCVPVHLDLEYVETLLKRAEQIRDAVKLIMEAPEQDRELLLPARITDRSECDGCPWRDTMCHPADAPVDPLLLAQDAELLAQLEKREQLDESATEFDHLDKRIKERFKLTQGTRFVVGNGDGFIVTKKPHGKGIRIDIVRVNHKELPSAV